MAGLRSVVVRISNPYGPRQIQEQATRRHPDLPDALAHDQPLTVYGDGTMIRDYLYVKDAVAMVVAVGTGGPQHDIYNIGSGVGVSVNELVSTLSMVTGREPRQIRQPKPATFVDRVVLDPTRYLREFGDDLPETGLAEGIAATWQNLLAETHAEADR